MVDYYKVCNMFCVFYHAKYKQIDFASYVCAS
jgi:hypothetical protein